MGVLNFKLIEHLKNVLNNKVKFTLYIISIVIKYFCFFMKMFVHHADKHYMFICRKIVTVDKQQKKNNF